MTNLQIAIEKGFAALEPHIREVTIKRKIKGKEKLIVVDRIVSLPAFVGPLQRRVIVELLQAAIKYNEMLEREPQAADILQAYAETCHEP